MRRISQNDVRWADVKIGKSYSAIGDYGCLITSLCMIWSKFHMRPPISPHFVPLDPCEAAKTWTFVKIPSDKEPKYLSWTDTDFDGMKFVWRNWDYSPNTLIKDPRDGGGIIKQIDLIKDCMKSKNYGVVFRVVTKNGMQHWVAGWHWGIFRKPICFDPWDGHIYE